MKFKNTALTLALGFTTFVGAQNGTRRCANDVPSKDWDEWFNQKVVEFKANEVLMKKAQAGATIPVIVHIIHGGQNVGVYPNITSTQVQSQITVLNQDYAGNGLNVNNVPSAFASLKANTGISFCLAMLDPNGNAIAEPGIDRVNYVSKGWSNPNSYNSSASFMSYMDGTVKPATIWDPNRYLNIWISDVSQNQNVGILGYASFPAGSTLSGIPGSNTGSSNNDGVWVYTRAFGNTGFVNAPYNKGRTATHEIGHWLGLRHVWGDGTTCSNNTDYCNDTPPQLSEHYGCPTYPQVSCSNSAAGGDMFMNFMDYSDDACLYMFTNDQNTRIQTALTFGVYRKNLTASSATLCNIPYESPSASFNMATEGCIDSVITVDENLSLGIPAPTYSWSSNPQGATFLPSNTASLPTITFPQAGTYTVALTAINAAGNSTSEMTISIADCGPEAGLRELNNVLKGVRLIPNPAHSSLTIDLQMEGHSGAEITIYNAVGQKVYLASTSETEVVTIDLKATNLLEGIYTVEVRASGEVLHARLIIAHP